MTQPKTNRIPAPIYAAAGAGELALEQLRKLPTVVGELRDRVVADGGRVVTDLGGKAVVTGFELRQKANDTLRNANQTAESLRQRATPAADLNRLREHADLAKLRDAADLNRLRDAADLNKLRQATDLDRLRELATRNAAVVVAGAHAAQERALAVYGALVTRGERVVGAGVLEAAETVNADIEATEATVEPATTPAPTTTAVKETQPAKPAEVPSPAEVAEIVEAKPAAAKKTTRSKATTRQPAAKQTTTPSAKLPRATKRSRPAGE
ncbi:hypothetical protein SAMN05443287_103657 [Micromonospora phaseoli]|uniref:Uncharacterized protein n=1 Tax=Micromonospora phaseoli TaxID=1144548 RepID=A0A1H6XWN4_9ACTN|nr:hypothetical protein [Micromonospora phaseoli]PZW02281.1 hypothetical protein CLV64_102655 [Micromonospora phaseoli]GIJ75715.1 hypothetical protein Xph01_01470 [Micromonospora phaseoli]SEJ28985.1 hypothetical protein SAMN05443287_103657 [Micromonospora phaseoli]